MANRLFINSVDVTSDAVGLDEFEIEIGLNPSTKTITTALSSPIKFKGATYEFFEKTFFSNCNSIDNEVNAVFVTDICGGIKIPLTVTVEGAKYMPDKKQIEVLFQSEPLEDEAYAKLDSDYWFDNMFPETYKIPIVFYADQPNWMQWLVILLVAGLRIILKFVDAWAKSVCKLITLGTQSCELGLTATIFAPIDMWISGLGRYSTAPLIREIVNFQCNKAGIGFSSSILNDPDSAYYNMAMFVFDRGKRGNFKDISDTKRIEVLRENAQLWTTIELLENLSIIFEAEYRIIKGVLYFERRDYFVNLAKNEILSVFDGCYNPEYEYKTDNLFAYGEFSFEKDGYDVEGNKNITKFSQRLEFNSPYSPAQKGKLIRQAPFGPTRFMFDDFSHNVDGFFDWENIIDEFRDGPDNFFERILTSNEGIRRNRDLVLTGNSLSAPKLLILEPNFNRNDAFTIRKPYQTKRGKQYYLYNYPLYYKNTRDKVVNGELIPGEPGPLTTDFAFIANPRLRKDKFKIATLETDCDCRAIETALDAFSTIYIDTHFGKGIPETINLTITKSKVKVVYTNITIYCND